MNVIFFSKPTGETGHRLQQMTGGLVPMGRKETYYTVDSLAKRLQRHSYNIAAAVLLTDSLEDLSNIVAIGHLFEDIKTILILPDRQKVTITKGHRLRPRYLSYADSSFIDVAVVLEKILSAISFENNQTIEEVK